MPLGDTFIRQVMYTGAKAGDKHSDGGGLYLLVNAVGKYWRMNYRFLGKQKTLALGVYPAVALAAGTDPSAAKQDEAREAKRAAGALFEAAALEWIDDTEGERSPETHQRVNNWFNRDVLLHIGQRPIDSLRPPNILSVHQAHAGPRHHRVVAPGAGLHQQGIAQGDGG